MDLETVTLTSAGAPLRPGRRGSRPRVPARQREFGSDRDDRRRARDQGVKVLLTGEGADELFAGYPLVHRRAGAALPAGLGRAWRYGNALLRGRIPVRAMIRTRSLPVPPARSVAALRSTCARGRARLCPPRRRRSRFEARLLASLTCSRSRSCSTGWTRTRCPSRWRPGCPSSTRTWSRLALNLPLEARTQPRAEGGPARRGPAPPAAGDREPAQVSGALLRRPPAHRGGGSTGVPGRWVPARGATAAEGALAQSSAPPGPAAPACGCGPRRSGRAYSSRVIASRGSRRTCGGRDE